jgi:hypothetical protein
VNSRPHAERGGLPGCFAAGETTANDMNHACSLRSCRFPTSAGTRSGRRRPRATSAGATRRRARIAARFE